MQFDVLTIFPGMFPGYLSQSLLKLAIARGLISVRLHNIRDWATGPHHSVDDRPFGGGPGMLLLPEPVVQCVESVQASGPQPGHLIMLTPQGRRLTQGVVQELAGHRRLLLLCGRYEGFDERVKLLLQPDELSVGDFVLNGGEVAAMLVMDAVMRLVPGVLGNEQSSRQDSFSGSQRLLEHAQYTRPRVFRGLAVPNVLLQGNHAAIERFRHQEQLERTQQLERAEQEATEQKQPPE